MGLIKIWENINEVWGSIKDVYAQGVAPLMEESGLDLQRMGLLVAVLKFEPEYTTSSHLMVRDPYTSAEVYQRRLAKLAADCLLVETEPAKYRLTEEGRKLTHQFITMARAAMASLEPIPNVDLGKLENMLERLVRSSLDTPPPPNKWTLKLSYKLMPEKKPAIPYIEQEITCLAAYRDDAHLAAWQRSKLSAMGLETLTLLWRSEIRTFDDLCERLAHREHDCQVYVKVLEDLRQRGLVEGPEKELWVTTNGRMFRNQIEEDTDRFFFNPWECLSAEERDELGASLQGLLDHLERGH